MNVIKKLVPYIFIILVSFQNNIKADNAYYLDFKYILNESTAGKAAQVFLKNKLSKGVNKLKRELKKKFRQMKKK